ncbi:hypothetical protein CVV26_00360 [Candidatus Kuenenbacteria bacterium HGW-Kuenenbacteria-1]|uniref:Uncharacterized protein n=1 Tax=Candidatus Kuenenbacteria bacterium HGW-Kuenenbacteria-1 TaxID=2013812 RepID=A0A2N1UP77_9BACT|nr:MAG: hypothetical protein CVV26_00360 [Candidatus Kuenenbacteria bacterium HGW-Kuenenbacteria-1]
MIETNSKLVKHINEFEMLVLDNFHGKIKGKKYRDEQWEIIEKIIKVGNQAEIEATKLFLKNFETEKTSSK